jgi:succinate dehydrogenase/fumarate reductase flavoprotein subunit
MRSYDVVIIGAGLAGQRAALTAGRHRDRLRRHLRMSRHIVKPTSVIDWSQAVIATARVREA